MSNERLHNEKELLRQIAAGDQPAFRILFDHYWDRLYANALHFTKSPQIAQDLTQETFIKIWMNRAKLADVKQFSAFIYTISRNLILDEFRKRVLPAIHHEFYDACLESDLPTPQDNLELQEVEAQLNTAISHLPAQLQQAFKLSRFQGMTHEQIARQMKISRITSQNYVARAIVALRKAMAGKLTLLLCLLLGH